MDKYEIELSAVFDTAEQAKQALSDAEEAVGKNNGEVIDSWHGHEDDAPGMEGL